MSEPPRRRQVRIDARRLVRQAQRHLAVADLNRMRAVVERPACVRLWIELIEDGLVDRPVGRRLCRRIGGEVAGDVELGSPGGRQMDDNEGNQDEYPQHDDKGETSAAARYQPGLSGGHALASAGVRRA